MPSPTFIAVPYECGRRGVGIGAGPLDLLAHADLPDGSEITTIEVAEHPLGEVAHQWAVLRELRSRVAATVAGGRVPIVLSGGCTVATAVCAATKARSIAWFDAHPDLHTPETTESGFLDGMALAVTTGRALAGLRAGVEGAGDVADEDVLLIDVRDADPAERAVIDGSRMRATSGAEADLTALAGPLYLHVDADVLDPGEATANCFAVPGGLTVDAVRELIASAPRPVAASLTAYDPSYGARDAALALLEAVVSLSTMDEDTGAR